VSVLEIAVRVGFVVAGVALWSFSQAKISASKPPPLVHGPIGDRLHTWSTPWHTWLTARCARSNRLLIVTSAGIDVFGIYLLAATIFGSSIRPFIALLIVFALRQLCEYHVSLPAPDGVVWHHPGFPSLLVTYHVANDYFFSGHTAVSAVAMMQLIHVAPWWVAALAVVGTMIEAGTVIVLRAHYTMDVVAAILAAVAADSAATWLAPGIDAFLNGLG
jgi:hypothetical protein